MKKLLKIYALSLGFTVAGSASAAELCSVTYSTINNWGSGAQQRVSVTNNGSALSSWNFSWNFSGSESVMSFWNVPSLTQSGTKVTASNNSSVATGGTFGFDMIIGNPSTTPPTEFFLNGTSCKTLIGVSSASVASSLSSVAPSSKSSSLSSVAPSSKSSSLSSVAPSSKSSSLSSVAPSSMSSSVSSIMLPSSKSSSLSSVSPSSTSSLSSMSRSSVSSSSLPAGTAAWILDDANSTFNFVTVKNVHTAEVQAFTGLQGSIDQNGAARLAINLNNVKTNIDIRDERMRNVLFETSFLPTLYYRVTLDLNAINAMPIGSADVKTLAGSLTLHGITANVSAEVLIVKMSTGKVSVSTRKPIVINSSTFDLDGGIDSLRIIANLAKIGNAVPVYFRLDLNANTNPLVTAINVPAAPSAPSTLTGAFNTTTSVVDLTWADSSNNETGFLVRRKDVLGFWTTLDGLSSNITSFEDILLDPGTYDYKVIAFNNSMPSAPSPIATVVAGTAEDPVKIGEAHYLASCKGCHGDSAQGVANIPALNTKREGALLESMINTIVTTMPANNPSLCDRKCAEAIVAYLKATYWDKDDGLVCTNPINYGARQLRLLTRREYQNTVNKLLGTGFTVDSLPGDALVGYFVNNTQKTVTSGVYDQYLITADKVATWSAGRNFANVVSCNNTFNQDCANKLVNEFAPKAFRRPLDSQEITLYTAMANGSKTGGDVKAGMQLALEGILSSPQFTYRHEIGETNQNNSSLASDAYELTSYEMATWLAYTYTDAPPDTQLWDKAVNGKLRDVTEIKTEITRLVATPEFSQKLGSFVNTWLATDTLNNVTKDPVAFPGLDFNALIPHMQQELRLFFSELMLNPQGKFATLYNADYTYVNGPLAQHYGINGVSGNQFVRVATTNRGGILANGGFMSRWADTIEPSPIRRAVRVRGRMLCQDVQDPPANVGEGREELLQQHKDELANPTTTNRRKYHLLTSGTTCLSCHEHIINPLGFGMEDFDSLGNPRIRDSRGNPVDASGELKAPQAWDNGFAGTVLPFSGTRGLADVMANLDVAQTCLPQTMFRYTMGIGVEDGRRRLGDYTVVDPLEVNAYACEVKDLKNTMIGQSPRKMLEELGVMDTVRYRKAWARQNNM